MVNMYKVDSRVVDGKHVIEVSRRSENLAGMYIWRLIATSTAKSRKVALSLALIRARYSRSTGFTKVGT